MRRLAIALLAVLTTVGAWAQNVTYLEYNTTTKEFDTQTCTTYTTVTDQTTAWTAGWYVVSSEVTIETRISVTGDVHLILANGASLSAPKGIACVEGNSLTIYGQSNDEATMGVLECGQSLLTTSPEWGYAAIGGENTSTSPVNGTITIHGGKVLAHASVYGAAIGGGYGNQNDKKDFGTIVINGGIISADNGTIQSNAQCPAIIGGGTYMKRGNITINGGTVTAYNSNGGGQGAKIGAGTESSWGIITINGGEITVSGFMGTQAGNMGSGIGGGVFLTSADNMTDPELDQIIITGGTINASAAYGAAAIGGGLKGKCGTIRISGGNITANAGLAAAAIGNGNGISVNEGNIIITGGIINATANASNARGAIGGSAVAYGPTISLSWTDAENDRITATTTNANFRGIHGSSVTVAEGKSFLSDGSTLTPTTPRTLAVTGYGESTKSDKWVFIASPIEGSVAPTAIGNLMAATESEYDLYRFNQSANEEWENYKNPTHTSGFNLVNGQGYLYANKGTVDLTFSGIFNDKDTQTVSLDYDDEATLKGYNLVGNPFTEAATIGESYYKMNTGGTDIEPAMSSTPSPAFTGVIVEATAAEQQVTFTKSGTRSSAKTESQGHLQLTLSEAGETQDKAIVSFDEGAQLGKYIFNKDLAKLYIPQSGKDYAIAYSDRESDMPVNFKATKNGTYTITVNPDGVEMAYLHLIDNMTGADVDLLPLCKGGGGDSNIQATYTFTAKTTDYESRFRLVFSICGDANGDNDGDNAPFAFISNGNIVITADTQNVTLQIVDAMGRMVVCSDGVHTVSTNGMTAGVYVLRLIDGDNVKTQKIVIQ